MTLDELPKFTVLTLDELKDRGIQYSRMMNLMYFRFEDTKTVYYMMPLKDGSFALATYIRKSRLETKLL